MMLLIKIEIMSIIVINNRQAASKQAYTHTMKVVTLNVKPRMRWAMYVIIHIPTSILDYCTHTLLW